MDDLRNKLKELQKEFKFEKKLTLFKSHEEQDKAEMEYWESQSPERRLKALSMIRISNFLSQNDREPRFQRVYKLVERKSG